MERLGGHLARRCRGGAVIYLRGELGAGKTTLVRGFLRQLGFDGAVKSPTYTLIEAYELDTLTLYHLDLYRVNDPDELEYVGVRELLIPTSLMLIEWPDYGKGVIPAADIVVTLTYAGAARCAEIVATTLVGEQMVDEVMTGHGGVPQ